MSVFKSVSGIVVVLTSAVLASGHGTPIHVEVANGQLVVSEGIEDVVGFASMMFFEDDEDGDPFAELSLPVIGPSVIYQIPGFDIFGMDDNSNLSIEVLLRPVQGSVPLEQRTLWYWNNQTELVEPAPNEALRLLARESRTNTLTPNDLAAPPPLLLSDPMTGQQGFHNHGLLQFALDNDPTAPAGAYGFFARLTSTFYAPSDPFLVVLNRNVNYEKMTTAALAINLAAKSAQPGDYDGNGEVDPADYLFWKARFGDVVMPLTSPDGSGNGIVDAADYTVWRDALIAAGAGADRPAMVPEPPAAALVLALGLASCRLRRNCVIDPSTK
jgi:hypothetical protein